MNVKCDCVDWRENIFKVDEPRLFLALRNPHGWDYDGKVFVFCPWCGAPLKPPPDPV